MLHKSLVLLVVGTVIFLLCSASSADVPHMINYQGKLTTAAGGCLNDTVQMTFSIYPDTLGSPADWSETQTEVVVKEGIFNVLLGAVDTIPSAVFDGNVKYLGVQVESDPEMRPLKPMVSVAYAYRAGTVDGGAGGGWVDDGTVVRLENSTDNVGIGTTSPGTYKLNVNGSGYFGAQLNIMDPNYYLQLSGNDARIIFDSGSDWFRFDRANNAYDFIIAADKVFSAKSASQYLRGDVGIGTLSPTQKLDVAGTAQMTGFKMPTGASNGYVLISDGSGLGTWQPTSAVTDSDWIVSGDDMYCAVSGNVGIGTTVPSENLDINENSETGPEIRLMSQKYGDDGDKHGIIRFRGRNGEGYGRDVSAIWSENHGDPYWLTNWQGRLSFGVRYRTDSDNYPPLENPILSIMAGDEYDQYRGRVGIMTTTPSYELDVAGTAQLTGFKMPTDASNGYVLTSDASGVGTWQAPPSGIGGSGTANYIPKFTGSTSIGNSVIFQVGNEVGIGTIAPTAKLEVEGEISTGDVGIRWKKITGTTDNDAFTNITTGISTSKVLGYDVFVQHSAGTWYPPSYEPGGNQNYYTLHQSDRIELLYVPADLQGRPYKVLVRYED